MQASMLQAGPQSQKYGRLWPEGHTLGCVAEFTLTLVSVAAAGLLVVIPTAEDTSSLSGFLQIYRRSKKLIIFINIELA